MNLKSIFVGTVIGFLIGILSIICISILNSPKQEISSTVIPLEFVKKSQLKRAKYINYTSKPFTLNYHLECEKNEECKYLAEAIYFEARGEPIQGQIAVGWVIVTRALSKKFKEDSIKEVITKKCHFSYRCDGSLKKGIQNEAAYERAIYVASNILRGNFSDPTNGADHYLNPDKVKRVPKWAIEYPVVAVINNHQFHIWK